ncbi:molybdenum ABC transporter ATP-binding protein [Endozoicomonas sp. (ex Bugula neritina AB1)]|nr:molybdenum ABC transporter ATP-binding protein [Endozoicomonas sp. (ex Bugula neritina AB1)]
MVSRDMLDIDLRLPRDQFQVNIKCSLPMDEIWAVMGPSGCGKTSLLRCLAGLESGAKGRISFNGEVWQDSENGIWISPEQRGVGYIFQEARLFPHLNVMGNLEFAQRRASTESRSPELSEVIQQLGIEPLLGRRIERLSGGEKQRVAIARTLLNAPRLLLMDEPLASLDWASKAEILPCLRDVHRHFRIPVVMVSHAREEVARLADQLLIMNSGEVVSQGSCAQLMNRSGSLLASDNNSLSVLEACVFRHDDEYPLTELMIDNKIIVVNQIDTEKGSMVRVVLSAHEVSIVLEDVAATSVQNRLSVVIAGMTELDSHHMLLSLKMHRQTLQALITRRSFVTLKLKKGMSVFAHFKAACLDVI